MSGSNGGGGIKPDRNEPQGGDDLEGKGMIGTGEGDDGNNQERVLDDKEDELPDNTGPGSSFKCQGQTTLQRKKLEGKGMHPAVGTHDQVQLDGWKRKCNDIFIDPDQEAPGRKAVQGWQGGRRRSDVLFHHDGGFGDQGCHRPHRGQGGRQHQTDHTKCQRELDQDLALFILDDNAANVALVD
jgi:hypothetical protein